MKRLWNHLFPVIACNYNCYKPLFFHWYHFFSLEKTEFAACHIEKLKSPLENFTFDCYTVLTLETLSKNVK